jgi:hypothetical protein
MLKLLTSIFVFMHLFTIRCLGYVIAINLVWNSNHSPNIMEGSVVQLIGYSSSEASPPVATAEDSFDEVGDNSYNPYSTPENHEILYETAFVAQGNNFRVNETYNLLESYDRVYLRIFSSTNLDDEVYLSYWGLGAVSSVKPHGKTSVYMAYNEMTNQNNFTQPYFEVIPEPPVELLFLLGGSFLYLSRCKIRDRARCARRGSSSRRAHRDS